MIAGLAAKRDQWRRSDRFSLAAPSPGLENRHQHESATPRAQAPLVEQRGQHEDHQDGQRGLAPAACSWPMRPLAVLVISSCWSCCLASGCWACSAYRWTPSWWPEAACWPGSSSNAARKPPTGSQGACDGAANENRSLTPLILFAASPGTITGVITLAVAHARLTVPLTALTAVVVGTLVMWLVIALAVYFGVASRRDRFRPRHRQCHGLDRDRDGESTRSHGRQGIYENAMRNNNYLHQKTVMMLAAFEADLAPLPRYSGGEGPCYYPQVFTLTLPRLCDGFVRGDWIHA